MIHMLMFLLMAIVLFYLFAIAIQESNKRRQPAPAPKVRTSKQRHEELLDTLEWMLQNNIISYAEYNNLLVKSLPYIN